MAIDPRARDGVRSAGVEPIASATPPRWRRALSALGQFAFPRSCAACDGALDDTDRGIVCGRCWTRLPLLPSPRCERCGHPAGASALTSALTNALTSARKPGACAGCALLPPFVRAARSLCWVPDDTSSALLSALKYDGWPAVAEGIGSRLARLPWPADVVAERAALVPVPLAPVKERARGFNQAELLADAVAAHWRIPVWHDALQRTRATPSQTRLTPGERLANVHGAFAVTDACADRLRGTHVVLVDDVLTTGATLNACANALFAAGTRTMSYLTFGRARTAADR